MELYVNWYGIICKLVWNYMRIGMELYVNWYEISMELKSTSRYLLEKI